MFLLKIKLFLDRCPFGVKRLHDLKQEWRMNISITFISLDLQTLTNKYNILYGISLDYCMIPYIKKGD